MQSNIQYLHCVLESYLPDFPNIQLAFLLPDD